MSVSRPCRLSQVASSLLILTPGSCPAPRSTSCTTIVRSGVLFLGAFGGGGWGTSASNPRGVRGVITIKMISSTSRTSMSGVTLMFAFWPPLGPTAIPIVVLLLLPARCIWRRRGLRSSFPLLGEQAKVVHARGAHRVYDLDHIAEVGALVSLHVNAFVRLIGETIFYLTGQIVDRNPVSAEEYVAISHDRDEQRVFLVGIGHLLWVVHFGHVHADAMLQHGRDHHEDDQQHQHHVHHGSDVDVGVDLGSFVSCR